MFADLPIYYIKNSGRFYRVLMCLSVEHAALYIAIIYTDSCAFPGDRRKCDQTASVKAVIGKSYKALIPAPVMPFQ